MSLAHAAEYVNRYGTSAYTYDPAGPSDMALFLFILWIMIILGIGFVLYQFWEDLSVYWKEFVDRNRVKTVVIEVDGHFMNMLKFDKLTEDVNGILQGQKLPQISKVKNLNAKNILGVSTTPGKNCNIFTIWYK